MNESLIIGFWLLSLSLTVTPGADWAYVMSAGIARRILPALFGMLLGYLIVIVAVMFGVGAAVASSPVLLSSFTFIGAFYLLWLGVQVFRQSATLQSSAAAQNALSRWIAKGIAVSGLNPKVLLMFIALIPPFLTPQTGVSLPLQIFLLGSLHLANCALIYPFVGLGVGKLVQKHPACADYIRRFSGIAMVTLAVMLVVEQLQ
ncbi:LysE family translocator [Caviibacterium pharyngocola]|uniref:Lysine transporter LysE n=1 Tax=Caviibacterium pharyngocola TaxID=28159 RepID=A0A2M8RUA6_9PAST|nr:LysE family translocator [Caviibacterium pharyngocola]PJG82472.1 lysine transporter LysE [Caviibacterium pharyngocola]